MKMLDPGSVVRESELGMALNATGIWDKATNYKNKLLNGQVLTPSQAKEFEAIAKTIYDAAEQNHSGVVKQYTQRSNDYGMNPKHVVTDYSLPKNNTPKWSPEDESDPLFQDYLRETGGQ